MRTKNQFFLIATLALVLSTTSAWFRYQATGYMTFATTLHVETEMTLPIFQVFYDIGKGYREKDSRSFLIDSHVEFQPISFMIPSNTIHGLRLDFLNGPGSAILSDTALISKSGEMVFTLSAVDPLHGNQVVDLNFLEKGLAVSTIPQANDPYIILTFSPPLVSPPRDGIMQHAVFPLKIFAILFVGMSLLLLFTGSRSLPGGSTSSAPSPADPERLSAPAER